MIAALKAPVVAAYMLAGFGSCDAQPPAVFDFKYEMAAPTFHRDLDSAQLQRMKGAHSGPGQMGGLTRNETHSAVNINSLEQEQLLGGDFCLWPAKVEVRITLRPTVRVASQYPQNSCRYKVAYLHEMMHVKIARDTLMEFMPGLEAFLRAKVASLAVEGPLPEENLNAAKQRQLNVVQDALVGALKRIDMVTETRQAKIDTPQSYLLASRACAGEPLWGER
jgi:hypothetical protein